MRRRARGKRTSLSTGLILESLTVLILIAIAQPATLSRIWQRIQTTAAAAIGNDPAPQTPSDVANQNLSEESTPIVLPLPSLPETWWGVESGTLGQRQYDLGDRLQRSTPDRFSPQRVAPPTVPFR